MKQLEANAVAYDIISSNQYMTLATVDDNGVWTAPLWYAYGTGKIFFISNTESRHAKAVLERSSVSVSIFDSRLPPEKVNGLQIVGRCRQLRACNELLSAIAVIFMKRGAELFSQRIRRVKDPFSYLNNTFGIFEISIYKAYVLDPEIIDDDIRFEVYIS